MNEHYHALRSLVTSYTAQNACWALATQRDLFTGQCCADDFPDALYWAQLRARMAWRNAHQIEECIAELVAYELTK